MFPGQGAQYVSMGKDLYKSNILFKTILDECFQIVKSSTGKDLKSLLFENTNTEDAERELASTDITQPVLFIYEYALVKLFEQFGIRPKYLIGHSIGEYTAACIAGVFDMQTALKIVIKRGQLMSKMNPGSMIAVRTSIENLKSIDNTYFEIAADNAPEMCTISLNSQNVDKVIELLDKNEIQFIPLNTSHGFHSEAFDPILSEFEEFVDSLNPSTPVLPFISCLTGKFITDEQATTGAYWAQQLRHTVHFREGISTISSYEDVIFLEVGPNTHLSSLVKQNKDVENKKSIIATLGKADEVNEQLKIITALGNMFLLGTEIDFNMLQNEVVVRKISLPTYPFERIRHWIDFVPSMKQVEVENSFTMTTSKRDLQQVVPSGGNGLVDELKAILFELSGLTSDKLNEEVSFEENGLDSLFLVQFASHLEKKYKVKVEFRQLAIEYSTLKGLAKLLSEKSPYITKQAAPKKNGVATVIDNFVKFQPLGNKEPLIIVHGDNANKYGPELIGTERPFYGFLHIGSDGEKINFKSVDDMSEAYLEQLLIHKPKGPYYLGGYSFGGVLAYDMAVKLQKMGHEVPFLALIDTWIPLQKEPVVRYKNPILFVRKKLLGPTRRKIELLSKRYLCRGYILLHIPVPVKLRNFYILDKYHILSGKYSGEKFKGEVILFRATKNRSAHKYLGWDKLVDKINLVHVEGDHETIIEKKESFKEIHKVMEKYLN